MSLHPTRIPHSLRLIIALLRIALGLNFFYLAFNYIVNSAFRDGLAQAGAMGNLYAWLNAPEHAGFVNIISKWALLVVGIGLTIGFATRLLSLIALVLIALAYLASPHAWNMSQLVNDSLITILCLGILIFSRAGSYLGLDKFFHFSLFRKK